MAALYFFYRGVTPIPHFKPENPILYLVANIRYFYDTLKRQVRVLCWSLRLWLCLLIDGRLLYGLRTLTLHFPCVELSEPLAVPFAAFHVKRHFDFLADIRTLVHLVAEKLHTHFLRVLPWGFDYELPFLKGFARLACALTKSKTATVFPCSSIYFLISYYPLSVNQDSSSGHNASRFLRRTCASGKNRIHL